MATTLTIDDETLGVLSEQAFRRGVAIPDLIRQLAIARDPRIAPPPKASKEEFARVLRELAVDAADLPVLPDDFSREDIYFDHD